jgi:hypothetical protein
LMVPWRSTIQFVTSPSHWPFFFSFEAKLPLAFASCIHAHNYRKSIVNLAPALRNPQLVCWIHWEVAGTDMYQKTAEEKTRYERGKSRHSCSCQRP